MADELSPEESRRQAASGAARDFARTCRTVEEHAPADAGTALDELINELMTELWDNGFSTSEIRVAFEAAAQDVGRYAGLDKRNGSGIRGTAPR